ncbi:MAG: cobyric acid synthase [Methanomicrobiales archaeon]|nr:cobyric acid synthase [Methanomicrobiales archaeon]
MSLMIFGTASHVGKSTVVAALCRCLADEGIDVAPFKSQNMSLNSYVTVEGGEISIAQAIQARAARLEPHVDMNPILLKPRGDRVSQVVVLGRPYRDLPIGEYYREVDRLLGIACSAAERLGNRYGHLIVEGAGGAAELNLYDRDIANIRIARALKYPIILVADIERGGVFAQICGTIALLPDDIRPLVKGVIVNKFRGDPELFEEGIRLIEERCGVPVLGLLPYADLPLHSEDSLSIDGKRVNAGKVRIAIIRHPRISNFTDFELLERHASVEYVKPGAPLEGFDCIILPGTKNTIEDLEELRRSGGERELLEARERGVPIIGICGGFQMLGRTIVDTGIEAGHGTHRGLGLLNVMTVFDSYRKTTLRVRRSPVSVGPILSRMGEVEGYEIHMGQTENAGEIEAFEGEGAVSGDGLVIGTYMHGLFQNGTAVDALLSHLHGRKGLEYQQIDMQAADPYDVVAGWFREHVDMRCILRILKERAS